MRNYYISTIAMSMATTFGWVISKQQVLLPIKSHDLLITWPSKITRQTKMIISPVLHYV